EGSTVLAALGAAGPFAPGLAQGNPKEAGESGRGAQGGRPGPRVEAHQAVSGDAVERVEPGKVYVVEFWATWCGTPIHHMPLVRADGGKLVAGEKPLRRRRQAAHFFIRPALSIS